MFKSLWFKRLFLLLIVYLAYLWSWHSAFGEEPTLEGKPMPSQLLEESLKKHIPYHPSGPNSIGRIRIDDRTSGITQATWLYVKSALDYYKKNKPIFIILELNTPGGELFSAEQISDALKDFDTQLDIPVVAYINNWAISAGALLAYSCRYIAVVKDASMGAAEPVMQDTSGKMEAASEKVNSAIRADFANRARFFERNPYIAEAMVDKDTILVRRQGKVIKLDNENQIKFNGPEPDALISPKGKLLTLDSEQLLEYGVADIFVPPTKTEPITAEEQSQGKWSASKMALFKEPFFDQIPEAFIDDYRMDWKTEFFALLASPVVSSLLFLGLVVGFYFELTTPGFGLAGTVGVTCLILIILSSFSLEIASWLEVILLFVGIGILLVELFVLPTFGLLGVIGILFFLMGLFGMMLPGLSSMHFDFDSKTLNAAGQAFFEHLGWLCGALVAAFALIAFLSRYITPRLAGLSRFVLHGNEQEGFSAVDSPSTFPQRGAMGEAMTTLRPAGKVIVNDRQYDAVSMGPLIEKHQKIIVVGFDGGAVVVAPIEEKERKE